MCLARCSFLPKRFPHVSSVQTNCGGSLYSRKSCVRVPAGAFAGEPCCGVPVEAPPLRPGAMKFGGTGCRSITNNGGGGDGDRQL
jgi:hypothetical protein